MTSIADIVRAAASGLYGSVGGWPVDTGVSLANLARAGYGYGGSKLGLLAPQDLPDMIDPANVPGSTASIAGLLGVGNSMPEQAAQIIGGLLGPGGKKAPSKLDMTVYHGSPHSFENFDMSHLGSGEGAQAYGHGLYFADNPQVAKSYVDPLYKARDATQIGGRSYDDFLDSSRGIVPTTTKDRAVLSKAMAPAKSLEEVAANLAELKKSNPEHDFRNVEALFELAKKEGISLPQKGNLYTVDITDDAIAKMLHWDKPLSEQPAAVVKAMSPEARGLSLQNYGPKYGYAPSPMGPFVGPLADSPELATKAWWAQKGGDAYHAAGAERESARLREAGIPGIRYLDGGSRATGGTYNTVLFDDALAKILSRE